MCSSYIYTVDTVDTCRLERAPIAASKFEVQFYLEVPRDVVLLLERLMTFGGSQDFNHATAIEVVPISWGFGLLHSVHETFGNRVLSSDP